MAVSYVGIVQEFTTSSSFNAGKPPGWAVGDLLILFVTRGAAGVPTLPANWTVQASGALDPGIVVATKFAESGEPNPLISNVSGYTCYAMVAYRGVTAIQNCTVTQPNAITLTCNVDDKARVANGAVIAAVNWREANSSSVNAITDFTEVLENQSDGSGWGLFAWVHALGGSGTPALSFQRTLAAGSNNHRPSGFSAQLVSSYTIQKDFIAKWDVAQPVVKDSVALWDVFQLYHDKTFLWGVAALISKDLTIAWDKHTTWITVPVDESTWTEVIIT